MMFCTPPQRAQRNAPPSRVPQLGEIVSVEGGAAEWEEEKEDTHDMQCKGKWCDR